jgi:hypothetical protein
LKFCFRSIDSIKAVFKTTIISGNIAGESGLSGCLKTGFLVEYMRRRRCAPGYSVPQEIMLGVAIGIGIAIWILVKAT